MKALSLWQPWATLVALGVKTIETRSWATSYRGPLAIHAGITRPPLMHLPPYGRGREGQHDPRFLCIDTITDPAFMGPLPQGKHVPTRAKTPTLFFPRTGPHGRPHEVGAAPATEQGSAIYLPLGAVVATCTLVDVVPIVHTEPRRPRPDNHLLPCIANPNDGGNLVALWRWNDEWGNAQVRYFDQRPYGDFALSRWAWLLADITPLAEPIPTRGHHGLWNWQEAA